MLVYRLDFAYRHWEYHSIPSFYFLIAYFWFSLLLKILSLLETNWDKLTLTFLKILPNFTSQKKYLRQLTLTFLMHVQILLKLIVHHHFTEQVFQSKKCLSLHFVHKLAPFWVISQSLGIIAMTTAFLTKLLFSINIL